MYHLTISEFGPGIYVLKMKGADVEQITDLQEVKDFLKEKKIENFEIKSHDHGIWILKIKSTTTN